MVAWDGSRGTRSRQEDALARTQSAAISPARARSVQTAIRMAPSSHRGGRCLDGARVLVPHTRQPVAEHGVFLRVRRAGELGLQLARPRLEQGAELARTLPPH